MLILHGGGWFQNGPGQVQSVRSLADIWRRRGWRTLNLDYHACARSVGDVVGLYDHFRKLANGQAICALGESAGGHLALMLAAERPEVRCAIGYAAPVDLPALPAERTSGALPGQTTSSGPAYVYNLAAAAFGASQLAKMSPALQAGQIQARVLLAVATDDVLIPWSQLRDFAGRRRRHTRIMQVPPGPVHWVHGTTTALGIQQVSRAAFRLAAGLR
jgi:acetyl esterase/lipase